MVPKMLLVINQAFQVMRQVELLVMDQAAQALLIRKGAELKRMVPLVIELLLILVLLVAMLQVVRVPPRVFGALTTPSSVKEKPPTTMLHTEEKL